MLEGREVGRGALRGSSVRLRLLDGLSTQSLYVP